MIAGIMLGLCALGALVLAYEMGKATGYECGYSDARSLQRAERRTTQPVDLAADVRSDVSDRRVHEGTDRFNSTERSTGR